MTGSSALYATSAVVNMKHETGWMTHSSATARLGRLGAQIKNPIGVVRGSEGINNSLLDDTTDAKCFLHFNSVWFYMNGVSNLQIFL